MEIKKADYIRLTSDNWIVELDPNMDFKNRYTVLLKPKVGYQTTAIFDDSKLEELIAILSEVNKAILQERDAADD